MLTLLSLTNFKAWKHIDKMRLAPITALFGTNSSGKSSILQCLLMLKQTADSADGGQVLRLGDEKSLVTLGTFSDIIYAHDINAFLTIEVEWLRDRPLRITNPNQKDETLVSSKDMGFTTHILSNGSGKLAVSSMSYGLGSV